MPLALWIVIAANAAVTVVLVAALVFDEMDHARRERHKRQSREAREEVARIREARLREHSAVVGGRRELGE